MKIISLNVEGTRHYDTVISLFKEQEADVICLQEAPEEFVSQVEQLGYQTTFALRCLKSQEGYEYKDGIVVASKNDHKAITRYYYQYPHVPDDVYLKEIGRRGNHQVLIDITVSDKKQEYRILNTHFTWSIDGFVNSAQQQDMDSLLTYTKKLPPHLLCGDFNLPRKYNDLYEDISTIYQDNVPDYYDSSLDPNYHRIKDNPKDAHHLYDFMVDYIFSQPPYHVENLELKFGVSDHAAVIADVTASK